MPLKCHFEQKISYEKGDEHGTHIFQKVRKTLQYTGLAADELHAPAQ
jgi:hypothetical protein